jgi:hypothetical protein
VQLYGLDVSLADWLVAPDDVLDDLHDVLDVSPVDWRDVLGVVLDESQIQKLQQQALLREEFRQALLEPSHLQRSSKLKSQRVI